MEIKNITIDKIVIFSIIPMMSIFPHISNKLLQLFIAGGTISIYVIVIIFNFNVLLQSIKNTIASKIGLMLGLLIFLIVLGFIRAYLNELINLSKALMMSVLWIIIYLILKVEFYKYKDNYFILYSLLNGFLFIIFLNFIFYILGFTGVNELYISFGSAKILSLLGIHTDRILFLFANGVNGYGIVLGAGLVYIIFSIKSNFNLIKLSMLFILFISLLLVDTRGAILAVISTSIIILLYKILRKTYVLLAILYPFIFVLLFYSVELLKSLHIFDSISRGSLILSGREYVWGAFFNNILEFLNENLILGYGYFGHVTSGVSQYYAHFFTYLNTDKPEFASLHNTLLQVLFDFGLLGVLLIILLLYKMFDFFVRCRQKYKFSYLALLVYFVFAGSTDLVLTPYSYHLFVVFIAMVLFVETQLFHRRKENEKAIKKTA